MKRAVFCSFLFNREKCYARRCQEGRGILAHICQKVNKRIKIMPKTTRQKLKSQCPNVFPCINIVNVKTPIFKLVAPTDSKMERII